ncbi:hypothetical protein DUNSADRAFT_4316 [Dunaliella salina]|uniref:Myb-like domain-containing protein n=1 Tax=Dunaliella salina TaxID=3046 RepID=A0ABQ7H7M5_DUNSA|nr:hypothetical protein DUNSADRAFT_4316 [Dunaliella salina]|eukprot:KAF5842857.1 hypothetical protein DUNSADRAFT_4316 [Dunaliella salina]
MYTTRQWGDSPDPEPRLAQGGRNSRGTNAEDQADEVEFTDRGIQDDQLADARQRALQSLPQPPSRRSRAGEAKERKMNNRWSRAEVVMLVKLMCRFKKRWAAILEEDKNLHYGARLLKDRDQFSVKDKFRNLERYGYLTPEFLDWVYNKDTVGDFRGQALKARD